MLDYSMNFSNDKLVWNVFIEDFNHHKIVVKNVFDHYRFMCDLYKLKKEKDFDTFATEVKKSLMYSYWSKCEWEVVVTSWPTYITKEELDKVSKDLHPYGNCVDLLIESKIDVYDQVMLNWEHFITYLWNNKKLITKVY